ncbi:LamG-like jellyroll fold domain-containing protein [Streptomyces sp. NPDC088350]|uniref:protein kinase domain-containing protein n=1 Tax=Streptomyces sp. NPDC088350 TaxID=3365854 RepID=UPI00381540FE
MAALESDDPGSVGAYQLISRLGAGGMGRVYLGRSPGGRLVAVKVVHAELLRRPEFRARFRREVQAARSVSGAFTAPVIDADPDAPLPWLVTSYIAGPSLEQAVIEQGPFAPPAVFALAAGLAEALVSIHSVRLIHRDLKPSNVLLAEDGPRVIDFGIVRSVEGDSLTGTGLLAGSPGFMSPEQVAGAEITPASDVFCLGAVLAFAATGVNPFGGGPTPALLYRVVHGEPDVDSVADPALRALVSACLAKDPAHRPTPQQILSHVGPPATTPVPTRVGAAGTSGIREYSPTQFTTATASLPHPATRLDTSPPPPHPAPAPTPAPTRRGLLLAGAGTAVAVLGVGTGLWLTRSGDDKKGSAAHVSPKPSATAVPLPQPVGYWPLDATSGQVARDTVGGNDGTATDVRWQDGAAVFDGTSSQIVTAGPVIDTSEGRSFTVAAWVRLSALPGGFATAISQDADQHSCFYLQYSGDDQQWAFAGATQRAVAHTTPVAGVWTHLVGVCDGPARRLRIHVDGVQERTVADTTTAGGSLVVGRAKYNGDPVDFFPGAIRDVRVYDRALTPAQIKQLKLAH